MTLTAVSAFTPGASVAMSVSAVSSRLLLPGSGFQTALVLNHGPYPVRIVFGTNTAVASLSAGQTVWPGDQVFVGTGANTYIAAIALGGGPFSCELNISTGA